MTEQPKRKIKITGSGLNPVKWNVVDAETGAHIERVRRVEVIADARTGMCEALLYVSGPDIDIDIDATVTTEQRAQDERIASAVIAGMKRLIERTFRSSVTP